MYIAHVVLSYMTAFGLSLAVEGPMMGIEKWILATRGKHKESTRGQQAPLGQNEESEEE